MFEVASIAACFFIALQVVGLIVAGMIVLRDLLRKDLRSKATSSLIGADVESIRLQNLTERSAWADASVLKESEEAVLVRTEQILEHGDAVALAYPDRMELAEVIWAPGGKAPRIILRIEHVLRLSAQQARDRGEYSPACDEV